MGHHITTTFHGFKNPTLIFQKPQDKNVYSPSLCIKSMWKTNSAVKNLLFAKSMKKQRDQGSDDNLNV